VPEDSALSNDNRADLHSIPAAGIPDRREHMCALGGRRVDDEGHRLASEFCDLDIDADRPEIEDAGPRHDQAEVGCPHGSQCGALNRGRGVDEGDASAAALGRMERYREPGRRAGDDRRLLDFAASDPIPYALETDWPVGAAGVELPHLE
jgi:hypothetical protein